MTGPHNLNRSGSVPAPKFPHQSVRQTETLRRDVQTARGALAPARELPIDAGVEPVCITEVAVIVTSLDGTITEWAPGAERMFRYSRQEAIGQSLALLAPPQAADDHRLIIEQAAQGMPVFRPETVRLRKGGKAVDVRVTAFPLRDSLGIITVFQDLGEIRILENQLHVARKMETFGQLAGGVVHDFNNLLTVIHGYSEIALSRCADNADVAEMIGEIHSAALSAETLTRQLLNHSRANGADSKVIDVNAVVSDTETMLRRLIGEDIVITTNLSPTPLPARIDAGQFQQIVLNLAINARDAMPNGGRLSIETASVTLEGTGPCVMLAVSDTGVGMAPEVQARIFEPLFTTKPPIKGTGLGLASVDRIVREQGGHIDVRSELGLGSTFKVFMPFVHESVDLKKDTATLRINPRGHETVLLVEDEDSVRKFAGHVLSGCGYDVLTAANGLEALALADQLAGPIDILVSDVVMPMLGGRALADRLVQLRPKLRILFLSGYPNDAVSAHGVSELEFAFLQKPFSTGVLAQKVRDVLDRPAN